MTNAVILAAGNSSRMGKNIKKQYLSLNGFPLLCHSLKIFDKCTNIDRIYLTVPKLDIEMCQACIVNPLKLIHKVKIISGGSSRQSSVLNSLEAINDVGGLVLIHDAARPFVTRKLILKCISGVKKTGACIPAIQTTDSVKQFEHQNSFVLTLNRKNIWLAQTPQVFNFDLILNAYYLAKKNDYFGTDDSSILEYSGTYVNIVQGNKYNIKITTPEDLILAESIFKMTYTTL